MKTTLQEWIEKNNDINKKKLIIAGSRTITDYDLVKKVIKESGFNITEIVSGTARGIDQLGERFAKENNIPIKRFPAKWDLFGKSAGYKRNYNMANYADALIAIQENNSKGTGHMINIMKEKNKPVFVMRL